MLLLRLMHVTLAKSEVHIGSTSEMFAALMRVLILSAWAASDFVFFRSACLSHRDVNFLVRQDERGVGAGELGGRHGACLGCSIS
jgi:hypothetical protein